MDKQLPAIYNDPYISEYFKILYEEHKENKINETKELLDYISNMEKKTIPKDILQHIPPHSFSIRYP